MRNRYRKWRNRRWFKSLQTETRVLGTQRLRVTYRKDRLIGVEIWTPLSDGPGYGYIVFAGRGRRA